MLCCQVRASTISDSLYNVFSMVASQSTTYIYKDRDKAIVAPPTSLRKT